MKWTENSKQNGTFSSNVINDFLNTNGLNERQLKDRDCQVEFKKGEDSNIFCLEEIHLKYKDINIKFFNTFIKIKKET